MRFTLWQRHFAMLLCVFAFTLYTFLESVIHPEIMYISDHYTVDTNRQTDTIPLHMFMRLAHACPNCTCTVSAKSLKNYSFVYDYEHVEHHTGGEPEHMLPHAVIQCVHVL